MRGRKYKVCGCQAIGLIMMIIFQSSVASSSEPSENTIIKETREGFLTKDIPVTYIFHTPEIPVRQIRIISNINAGWTNVQVELLNRTRRSVDHDPPGIVYRNFNIQVGSVDSAFSGNIHQMAIRFRVNNTWLTDDNIDADKVSIILWDGSEWKSLITTKMDVDSNFTYYEANTTNFSVFAIAGREIESASPQVTQKQTAEGLGPMEAPSSFNFLGLMAIIGAFATVIVAKIAASKRQKEK